MVAAKDKTMAEVGQVFGISSKAVYGYVKAPLGCSWASAAPGIAYMALDIIVPGPVHRLLGLCVLMLE
jgi:hypothetical protein